MKKARFFVEAFFFVSIGIIFCKFEINLSDKFPEFLSFLSIAMGFCITSLSLIATAKFSKKLYGEQSPNRNDATLLHELVQKFQRANYCFLFSISTILVFMFMQEIPAPNENFLKLKFIGQAIIIYTIFLGLYLFGELINMFGKYVIQAAKKQ